MNKLLLTLLIFFFVIPSVMSQTDEGSKGNKATDYSKVVKDLPDDPSKEETAAPAEQRKLIKLDYSKPVPPSKPLNEEALHSDRSASNQEERELQKANTIVKDRQQVDDE